MSNESAAHDLYENKLLQSDVTELTSLFSLGWPAPHRVAKNLATEKWNLGAADKPRWIRCLDQLAALSVKHTPGWLQDYLYRWQTLSRPLFTRVAPTRRAISTRARIPILKIVTKVNYYLVRLYF
jgi:nitronate monooxygenase